MEDQGLAIGILVILHLAQKNHVVAAIVLANVAANEMSVHAAEQGHAGGAFGKFNSGKLIRQRGGKLPRKMMLVASQHVNREMSSVGKVGKAGSLPGEAPQNQGRLQRHRGK